MCSVLKLSGDTWLTPNLLRQFKGEECSDKSPAMFPRDRFPDSSKSVRSEVVNSEKQLLEPDLVQLRHSLPLAGLLRSLTQQAQVVIDIARYLQPAYPLKFRLRKSKERSPIATA